MVININQMIEISSLQSLFSRKPLNKNISSIKYLKDFIESYPNDLLKPSLYQLSETYQYYRPINGDGNCFYRAIMFLYLKYADLSNFQTLFRAVDLLKCKRLPFQVNKAITSEQILMYLWQTQLYALSNVLPQRREKTLEDLMNKSFVADAVLIAYFRMLNYEYLANNRQEIQPYTVGGVQNDLQRVQTFGQQSQGVQIYSLAKILDIKIEIIMVHPENLQELSFNSQAQGNMFKIFYRPGHYDLIINVQHVQSQKEPQKLSFSQFYKENYKQQQIQTSKFANESKLSSRVNANQASRIISVSRPEEIRFIHSSMNKSTFNNKDKISFKQFKQATKIRDLNAERSQATNQPNSIKLKPPIKIAQTIEIKSEYLAKKSENTKKQMIKQSVILAATLAIIAFGFTII